MKNIPSIDEMINAGKTLPEIQAELRKIVAARDEAALKVQLDLERRKKIKEARAAAVIAVADYCTALGASLTKRNDLIDSLNTAFESYEKELESWFKILDKMPDELKSKSKSTLDTVSLEDALAQLRTFADSL